MLSEANWMTAEEEKELAVLFRTSDRDNLPILYQQSSLHEIYSQTAKQTAKYKDQYLEGGSDIVLCNRIH